MVWLSCSTGFQIRLRFYRCFPLVNYIKLLATFTKKGPSKIFDYVPNASRFTGAFLWWNIQKLRTQTLMYRTHVDNVCESNFYFRFYFKSFFHSGPHRTKYRNFSGPYFPVFRLNRAIYLVLPISLVSLNYQKYGPEKKLYFDFFHAVSSYAFMSVKCHLLQTH